MRYVLLRYGQRAGSVGLASRHSEVLVDVDDVSPSNLRTLANDSTILGIAPDVPVSLVAPYSSGDEESDQSWVHAAIGLTESEGHGEDVVAAVVDTGVERNHEYLRHLDIAQKDLTGTGEGDANGHGTHCASLLSGLKDSVQLGIAPGVKQLLDVKVLDAQGGGDLSNVFRGLTAAHEQGADVISMSLGVDFTRLTAELMGAGLSAEAATSEAISEYVVCWRAFESLAAWVSAPSPVSQGSLILAAAGNESNRDIDPRQSIAASPFASAPSVVCVGAIEDRGSGRIGVAPFSNHGVDVSAPGVSILGARLGGGSVSLSGTSMATPIAAGAAARWLSLMDKRTGSRVSAERLRSTVVGRCEPVAADASGPPGDAGAGCVQCPGG